MAYNGKYAKPSAFVGAVLMRTAMVLLCLVVLSVYLMGGLMAKYHAVGSGEDDARVAKFEVNVSGALDKSAIVCTAADSDNGTYTITIENKSEVAVHYKLAAVITDKPDYIVTEFSAESGDLAPGATGTSMLTFTVDWNKFTADKSGSSASKTLTFQVTVDAEQID